MEWIKFFPAHFEIGTRHLSAEEVGCYIRLLCAQALTGDLPVEFDRISRIAGGMSPEVWEAIKDKFPVVDGVRRNERMHETTSEALKAREAARESGRKGGLARAKKASKTSSDPSSDPSRVPQQKERSKERENEESYAHDPEDEFLRWTKTMIDEFDIDQIRAFQIVRKLRETRDTFESRVWFGNAIEQARKARSPKAYLVRTIKNEFGI